MDYVTGGAEELRKEMEPGDTVAVTVEKKHRVLTREEALERAEDCRESMIQELQKWIRRKAWTRTSRRSKRVLKWKQLPQNVKVIMVAQGFLDDQKTETSAATSAKWSHRLLIIVVVNRGWTIHSADISEAFLRGSTFDELAEAGETEREVALQAAAAPQPEQWSGT